MMLILQWLMTGGVVYWWWWAHRKLEKLNEYEFKNRTGGGVVEFETYKDAKKHNRLKWLLEGQVKIAGFLAVIMLIATFVFATFVFGHKT